MAKVLIVDNSEDILEVLSVFLQMKGYFVKGVSLPGEAIAALSAFCPDIILLDVRLDGRDGREICREIKQNNTPAIPIILLSASPALLTNPEDFLADAAINKPFDLNDVAEKIEQLLR